MNGSHLPGSLGQAGVSWTCPLGTGCVPADGISTQVLLPPAVPMPHTAQSPSHSSMHYATCIPWHQRAVGWKMRKRKGAQPANQSSGRSHLKSWATGTLATPEAVPAGQDTATHTLLLFSMEVPWDLVVNGPELLPLPPWLLSLHDGHCLGSLVSPS